MKVMITIQHPAHVHFFKNAIALLDEAGHNIRVVARKKDIVEELLNIYGIQHEMLAKPAGSNIDLAMTQLQYEYGVFQHMWRYRPDIITSIGEPSITHAGKIFQTPNLLFTDTEHATLSNKLAFPFADKIYTPESYREQIGKKQVRYSGFHELAYLHPNRFEPDPGILENIGINPHNKFAILRTVSWDAIHDIGDGGFKNVTDVVEALEDAGVEVFITAEDTIPKSLEHCRPGVEPHQIHHLMYYADLFIGESATMATESAVLGTPSIFVSSSRRGYTDELEKEYGLVFNYSGEDRHERALTKALSIIEENNSSRWEIRRKQMLEDKIDTTEFILNQIYRFGAPN